MKRFISFALVLCLGLGANNLFAQSSIFAVLNHNDTLSVYYGSGALKTAYSYATDNDVITLSEGIFDAVNIQKSLTIRGAGMHTDSINGSGQTVIRGDFSVGTWPETAKISLEGLYLSSIGYKAVGIFNIIKCRIWSLYNAYNSEYNMYIRRADIIQSKILYYIEHQNTDSKNPSEFYFINSYIKHPYNLSGSGGKINEFQNCIIDDMYNDNHTGQFNNLGNTAIRNSILIGGDSKLPSTSYAVKCVSIDKNVFENTLGSNTSIVVNDVASVFKTFAGTYSDSETFELTDEAKTKYLGTDDTEVGIYGGNMPFDPSMGNPSVVKCNVAAKSTADGKLSVDIQVKAIE